jgi:hypothetical protein
MTATAPAGSALRRLAQRRVIAPEPRVEQCDLCAAPVAPEHRHVVDVRSRQFLCACRACTILFDREGAGGGHFRLLPDRRLLIEDFDLDEASWLALAIPVDMAFFFHSTPAGRVMAFYPSPMGSTESLLELDEWQSIVAANPVLTTMEADVEALLVNRADGARQHWIVPVDTAYALVGLIRSRWKGLNGGAEVWEEITRFFEDLRQRGESVNRWHTSTPPEAPVAERSRGEGLREDG